MTTPNETEPADERPLSEKARVVLARAYRGIHHVTGTIRDFNPEKMNGRTEVNVYGGLATVDFDTLTRLVISAHDECLRMEIKPSGPGRLKLVFTNRVRNGEGMFDSCPIIEDAIAKFRHSR